MFPSFIISDANFFFITCNSNYLFWSLLRCNEDPDCHNPRGFRIPYVLYILERPIYIKVRSRQPMVDGNRVKLRKKCCNSGKQTKEIGPGKIVSMLGWVC